MVKALDAVLRPHLWLSFDGYWNCAVRERGVTFQKVSSVSPEAAYAYWLSNRPAWEQRAVLERFPSLMRKVLFQSPGFLS